MADTEDLSIRQGKTFSALLRCETAPIIYKAITGIAQTAPVRITAPGHAMVDGWRAAITNVKGMTEINAEANAVKDRDLHAVTVIDANTVDINDINAAGFKAYTSGGYLQYNTPVVLTGCVGRIKIKDKVGGTVLASSESSDSPIDIITVTIDATAKTITLTIDAADTAAITWTKGVYDLELVSSGGVVTEVMAGKVTVSKEVTT